MLPSHRKDRVLMESFKELIDGLQIAQGYAEHFGDSKTEAAIEFALDWFGATEETVEEYLDWTSEEDLNG
jgi:hypothetical protein